MQPTFGEKAKFNGVRVYPGTDRKAFGLRGLWPGDLLVRFCGVDISVVQGQTGDLCCNRVVDETVDITVVRGREGEREITVPLAPEKSPPEQSTPEKSSKAPAAK